MTVLYVGGSWASIWLFIPLFNYKMRQNSLFGLEGIVPCAIFVSSFCKPSSLSVSTWFFTLLTTYFYSTESLPFVTYFPPLPAFCCCCFSCSGGITCVALCRLSATCPRVSDSIRLSMETVIEVPLSSIDSPCGWTMSIVYGPVTLPVTYCIGNSPFHPLHVRQ